MKKLAALIPLLPTTALAHESFAPHSHPHGSSLLPDVTTLVIGAVLLGCFWVAARWFSKS